MPKIVWEKAHQRVVETDEGDLVAEHQSGNDAMGVHHWKPVSAEDSPPLLLKAIYKDVPRVLKAAEEKLALEAGDADEAPEKTLALKAGDKAEAHPETKVDDSGV